MEKKKLKSLENIMKNDIDKMNDLSLNDDAKRREILNDISKESTILNIQYRTNAEIDEKVERLNLDKVKQDNDIQLKQIDMAQQATKLDLEKRKIYLEEQKFEFEKEKFNKENEQQKKERKFEKIIGSVVDLCKVIIPVAASTSMAILSFKLTYKDHGIVNSDTKDFIRDIRRQY